MKRIHNITAIALAGLAGMGTLSAPIAASASEEGRRNTALGIGAAAVALLLTQKNKLPGLLAAGGAAYAFSQADQHRNNEDRARYRREPYGDADNRQHNQNDDRRFNQNQNRIQEDQRNNPGDNHRNNDSFSDRNNGPARVQDSSYRYQEQGNSRNGDHGASDTRANGAHNDGRTVRAAR